MYMVQILLPLYTNERQLFPETAYDHVRTALLKRFGGVTAYQRAPALGHWESNADGSIRDDIVVFEVMLDTLDRAWWADYREQLRLAFAQDKLIVRALPIEIL